MATMVAFKAGFCADCERPINVGETFEWGRNRGERVHMDCEGARAAAVDADIQRESSVLQEAEAVAARQWSKYQIALFDFGVNGSGSGMVIAVAGSGKTTGIEEFCRRLPSNLTVKYLVFNRKNADEARQRMPSNVDASTFHSSCNLAVRRRLGNPKIDGRKTWKMLDEMLDSLPVIDPARFAIDTNGALIVKLVGMGKNAGIGCLLQDRPEEWRRIIDHHGLEFDLGDPTHPSNPAHADDLSENEVRDRIIATSVDIASALLTASVENVETIDFDDMLYLTVKLGIALPQFDVVCVDEAQDTNAIQREILKKMVKPDGRLVAVGDPRQAIYGFRGADADAMDQIARDFKCIKLPLSINYRCSRAVIERVQRYCPEIEAWDGAPEGSVATVERMPLRAFLPTDAVLCRSNAPLVDLAYKMISSGVACKVMGRDIGSGLIALINKMQGKRKQLITLDVLLERLREYETREIEQAKVKGQEDKIESITDRVDCIRVIANGLPETERHLAKLIDVIERMFSDDGSADRVTLSSVHKAKGLEWPRVFILDPQRMPSKWAKRPWQLEQERNLIYVAYTRAKVDLLMLDGTRIVDGDGPISFEEVLFDK